MTLALSFAIIAAATALAIAAMLLARRHAPPGSRFTDSDRAAGVFGVIEQGWPAMRTASPSPGVEDWTHRLERVTDTMTVKNSKQDDAFLSMLANRDTREEARRERIGAAGHTVPTIMWVLLVLACVAPLLFLLCFADPAEPALVQGLIMGSVAALIAAAILAVLVLDSPFSGHDGSVQPKAMQYTLRVMELDRRRETGSVASPCTLDGRPLAG